MTEKKVKLETNMGDIIICLYEDMPVTTGNFEKLVREGFYDGIIFHRVINGFMIQAGCPLGNGTGGPGYNIKDEFVKGHSNTRGTIAMANTGQPDTGGSQFFINLVDNSYLDWDNKSTPYKHPVFGEVCGGMDVVDKIAKLPTDRMDKPKQEAKIIKAEIV
ncbi:peptidylprolyl isomerase [Methanomicrobium sp. W14]|uniref:peptidylprolyl isomerase n=1 Tax=Methanomicrobium sp. W14 TaxID=2817839 RepID=UPI001AEB5AB4|nr:peptidylprolyl isomerase [Methanomicrobium sp. W14]MBP2134359.1 peptidylprolyl isomerase [Methanomicrobium sp. W14]